MIKIRLRLWLATSLIPVASAVVLLTDRQRPRGGAGPSRTGKVCRAAYSETTLLDELIDGLRRGLKEAGMGEGTDCTTTDRNAQGDLATLNALFDKLNGDETDLIISISTLALQAALRKVDRKPVVFAEVLDPIAAGAGTSVSDHRPDVTGTYLAFPSAAMARTIRHVLPRARRVGTLFTPGEVDWVLSRQRFEELLKREGPELVSRPINGPTEVSDPALTLCQSGVDVLCRIADNLSSSSFPAIARACAMANTPLFTFSPAHLSAGGGVVGVVLAGEGDGLVGAAPRRSPVSLPAGLDPFAHPEVRDWLSFTPEPEHSPSTALVVGVATREAHPVLGRFVRPLLGASAPELQGHFHGAGVRSGVEAARW
ncbi:MAG TPA: ABC transporter substrate-binding protein [Isosphaeraceae bacterium]|nr:ABC transporter substrate-binding protein [Isosphaeraceae bacterium]